MSLSEHGVSPIRKRRFIDSLTETPQIESAYSGEYNTNRSPQTPVDDHACRVFLRLRNDGGCVETLNSNEITFTQKSKPQNCFNERDDWKQENYQFSKVFKQDSSQLEGIF